MNTAKDTTNSIINANYAKKDFTINTNTLANFLNNKSKTAFLMKHHSHAKLAVMAMAYHLTEHPVSNVKVIAA